MTTGAPEFRDAPWPRLAAALHPLDAPPSTVGWNLGEIADLLPGTPWVEAAVLVGLVPRGDDLHVVLTRRTEGLRQHGGQVSFPGGRVEPGDRDAVAAALRETAEEIGLPMSQVNPVGTLDPLVTISGFRVLPVVAAIDPRYVARPDPGEVEDVFEVSLRYLLDRRNLVARTVEFRGLPREVLEFAYPAQRIWGATASILLNLRQRLERHDAN